MSQIKPLARRSDIVIQEIDNEILIYDLRANKVFNLNETSAIIWQLSNGNFTISEIADNLTQKLNSPINEEFVWLALDQLRKEKLVENETEISNLYEGTSRREVIKRVGLATVAALPIIVSITAPTSVSAQSCVAGMAAVGCPCMANGDCGAPDACCGFALTCVTMGLSATGTLCRVNCECASGTCTSVPGPNNDVCA